MVEIDDIQANVREHLLGRVTGEERERFEERFITDSEFREVVLLIEGELFDDYAAGLLSDADRESFISQYVKSPSRGRDVQFTAALRDHVIEESRSRQIKHEARRSEESILNVLKRRWKPLLASGTLGLAALFIFWSVIAKWVGYDQAADFSAQVALLNKQPIGNEPSFRIVLQLIQNRTPGEGQKVSIPTGTSIVELQSQLPDRPYRSYQATLRVVNDGEVFSVDQLQPHDARNGKALHLRIPVHVLTPQDYIFSIKGVTAEANLEDVADYFFRIVK